MLVMSPSERQSNELVRKARGSLAMAGLGAKGDGQNRGSLVLPNGSRIIGLPSERGEGARVFERVAAGDR